MVIEYTQGVSTRLDDGTHQKIQELAQKEMRSMSNMVRVLLTEAIYYREMEVTPQDVLKYYVTPKRKSAEIQKTHFDTSPS